MFAASPDECVFNFGEIIEVVQASDVLCPVHSGLSWLSADLTCIVACPISERRQHEALTRATEAIQYHAR